VKLIKVQSLIITGLLFLFIGSLKSQNVFQKTYGGTASDAGEGIKATPDLGFIVAGNTRSFGTGGATEAQDFMVIKANLLGTLTWTRELGTNDKRQDAKSVVLTSDGGYIIGGRTHDATDNFNDDWLIKKYTAAGGSQIERVFGKNFSSPGIGANTDDELWSVKETAPFSIGMCGFSMNMRNPNKKDLSFVAFTWSDSTTNFSRHISTDSTLGGAEVGRDFIVNLTATTTYTLLGGSTAMVPGNGQDFFIAHLSFPLVNLSTHKSFGGTGADEPTSLIKTSDGGYMMVGFSNSPGTSGGNDILAIKLTSTFTLSWAKLIGGAGSDLAFQVMQTADNGYVIVGQTDSYGFGSTDMFVVKLTSTGTLSWAKCYGGINADDGRYMDMRSDGGFFFSGSCSEPISPAGNGQDLYLVATNSLGYSGGCNEMSVTPNVNNPSVAFTSATTGLSQTSTTMVKITQPMIPNSSAASLTCKCENYAPNKEIMGNIQVCHNTTGIYYVNKIPGHTLYQWTLTGATFVTPPAAGDTSVNINFTNTNAQLIVATNDGNCSDFIIDTINMTIDNIATAITTPDSLLCIGQGTALTANTVNNHGALSWNWQPSGPNNAVNNIVPGSTQTYTVTVTDAWLCTATDQINVQVFPYPVVNIGPNDTVCNGGPVLLNATTAGGTYLWNTSASTATINAATTGTYWVDVTTNGCTTRDSIILGISVSPTITITGDDSLCIGQGTTLTANPSGGSPSYTFLWAGGLGTSNTISPTPSISTTYTVTVTEGLGCTNTATKLVHVFPYPIVNLGPNDTVCNGGPVLLNATTAGGSYLWSTSASTATINAITSGTYWVDVTTNGCTSRDSIILGISTTPTITITGDDSLCIGQGTTLTANPSGGTPSYSFLWSGGLGTGNTISPTPASSTTYTVQVTESYGCTNTATKLVNVFSYPVAALGPDSGICNGVVPFVTLDAQNPGSAYTWSTSASTQTINVNTSGTYWVDVMLNGCTTRDSVMVTFSTNPTAGYTGNLVICNGQITTIVGNATGGTSPYTYTWSLGPTVSDSIALSPILTTNYNVIASDLGGCKDTAFFTIIVNQYPMVDIGPDTTGCFNSPITLFAPATTGTILWSTGANTNSISVPTGNTIWLDITENACTTRDSAIISYYPIPLVNLGNDSVICAIGNVLLDATNIYSTYLWSNSATTPTINVTQTGLYSVDVTSCGVDYYDSITVVMDTFSVFLLNVVPNDCGSNNGSLLMGDNSAYSTSYVWTSGSSATTPGLSNISDGTFVVNVTDSVGCKQTDTVIVVCNIPSIIITQLVTPNGDGKNDTWIIQGINNFPKARVTVFNRWGNEVYASTPYINDWDGKSNSGMSLGNDYLPAGTYFYTVDVYGDGTEIKSGYLEFQP
jgi:gliding motility-associated-like protein